MKMLKMNVLLGDMKSSQFFTKEHITIMTALMRMMTKRKAIMLMMLMMKMTMMQWHVKNHSGLHTCPMAKIMKSTSELSWIKGRSTSNHVKRGPATSERLTRPLRKGVLDNNKTAMIRASG